MKVENLMVTKVQACRPDTNLAAAAALMWEADCGILPVAEQDGKVIGLITDRDICIALGTRNRLPSDLTVGEVISPKVHACGPDNDVKTALETMRNARVRRLPVVSKDGLLQGILSLDDVVSHAKPAALKPDISYDDVATTYKALFERGISTAAG